MPQNRGLRGLNLLHGASWSAVCRGRTGSGDCHKNADAQFEPLLSHGSVRHHKPAASARVPLRPRSHPACRSLALCTQQPVRSWSRSRRPHDAMSQQQRQPPSRADTASTATPSCSTAKRSISVTDARPGRAQHTRVAAAGVHTMLVYTHAGVAPLCSTHCTRIRPNSGSADSENYRNVNSAYELRIHACIRLSQFSEFPRPLRIQY